MAETGHTKNRPRRCCCCPQDLVLDGEDVLADEGLISGKSNFRPTGLVGGVVAAKETLRRLLFNNCTSVEPAIASVLLSTSRWFGCCAKA